MALCGWASIDERGRVSGGAAGDQTGREVKVGEWYNFGQTVGLRIKNRGLANRAASVRTTMSGTIRAAGRASIVSLRPWDGMSQSSKRIASVIARVLSRWCLMRWAYR